MKTRSISSNDYWGHHVTDVGDKMFGDEQLVTSKSSNFTLPETCKISFAISHLIPSRHIGDISSCIICVGDIIYHFVDIIVAILPKIFACTNFLGICTIPAFECFIYRNQLCPSVIWVLCFVIWTRLVTREHRRSKLKRYSTSMLATDVGDSLCK